MNSRYYYYSRGITYNEPILQCESYHGKKQLLSPCEFYVHTIVVYLILLGSSCFVSFDFSNSSFHGSNLIEQIAACLNLNLLSRFEIRVYNHNRTVYLEKDHLLYFTEVRKREQNVSGTQFSFPSVCHDRSTGVCQSVLNCHILRSC